MRARTSTVIAVAVIALSNGACSLRDVAPAPNKPRPIGRAIAPLDRLPLTLPTNESPVACRQTPIVQMSAPLGPAMGSGPVYVSAAEWLRPDRHHVQKIGWFSSPKYSGPIRIRARQVDGRASVPVTATDNRWTGGSVKTVDRTPLVSELDFITTSSHIPDAPAGWRFWPSLAYISMPGCYSWQVDGVGFSEVITVPALALPVITPGNDCPVSASREANELSTQFGMGTALGGGPIYAIFAPNLHGSVSYSAGRRPDGLAMYKVLWAAAPSASARVVIRGHQLDGATQVGFAEANGPVGFALMWPLAGRPAWHDMPSEVVVGAPGCYGLAVEGLQNPETVIFRVDA